jgi:hypothetical protein
MPQGLAGCAWALPLTRTRSHALGLALRPRAAAPRRGAEAQVQRGQAAPVQGTLCPHSLRPCARASLPRGLAVGRASRAPPLSACAEQGQVGARGRARASTHRGRRCTAGPGPARGSVRSRRASRRLGSAPRPRAQACSAGREGWGGGGGKGGREMAGRARRDRQQSMREPQRLSAAGDEAHSVPFPLAPLSMAAPAPPPCTTTLHTRTHPSPGPPHVHTRTPPRDAAVGSAEKDSASVGARVWERFSLPALRD